MFLEHRQFEELKSLTPAQKKKFMATQLNALGELGGGKALQLLGNDWKEPIGSCFNWDCGSGFKNDSDPPPSLSLSTM